MTISVEEVFGYDSDQHCTFENQDGVNDYSFSHTAGYCKKPQTRFCGCGFCYGYKAPFFTSILEAANEKDFTARELNSVFYDTEPPDKHYYDESYYELVLEKVTADFDPYRF